MCIRDRDSYQHRQAGATEVLVSSAKRWALMHELREEDEAPAEALLAKLAPVDLVLIEGFKKEGHEKIEVYRRALGKPLLAVEDPAVVAVLSDGPVPETELPVIDLDDTSAIADFVERHCGLGGADRRRA